MIPASSASPALAADLMTLPNVLLLFLVCLFYVRVYVCLLLFICYTVCCYLFCKQNMCFSLLRMFLCCVTLPDVLLLGATRAALMRSCQARDLQRTRNVKSKQRDPKPKDNSLIRKEPSTNKGFHYTFAALGKGPPKVAASLARLQHRVEQHPGAAQAARGLRCFIIWFV